MAKSIQSIFFFFLFFLFFQLSDLFVWLFVFDSFNSNFPNLISIYQSINLTYNGNEKISQDGLFKEETFHRGWFWPWFSLYPSYLIVLFFQKSLLFVYSFVFFDSSFDITPRIVAFGYPAEGREAVYRNPMDQVRRFFDHYHKDKYYIYNLFVFFFQTNSSTLTLFLSCIEPERQYKAKNFYGRGELIL